MEYCTVVKHVFATVVHQTEAELSMMYSVVIYMYMDG